MSSAGFAPAPALDIEAQPHYMVEPIPMRESHYRHADDGTIAKSQFEQRRNGVLRNITESHANTRLRTFQQKTRERGVTESDGYPLYPFTEPQKGFWGSMGFDSFGCGSSRAGPQPESGIVCGSARFQRLGAQTFVPVTPRAKEETTFTQEEQREVLAQAPHDLLAATKASYIGQDSVLQWRQTDWRLQEDQVPEGYHLVHVLNLHDPVVDHALLDWEAGSLLRDVMDHLAHGDLVSARAVRHPQPGKVLDGVVQGHVYDIVNVRRTSNFKILIKLRHHEDVPPREHFERTVGSARIADDVGFHVVAEELSLHFDLLMIMAYDRSAATTLEILKNQKPSRPSGHLCGAPGPQVSTPLWSWWLPSDGSTAVFPTEDTEAAPAYLPIRVKLAEEGKMGFNGGINADLVKSGHGSWSEHVHS